MESDYVTMHGNRGNKEREEESGSSLTDRHSPTFVEGKKF